MFPCVHNSHSMFSLGPCENCKRMRLRSDVKTRSAEMMSRSEFQQLSAKSDRSIPTVRILSNQNINDTWTNPRDQMKRLQKRNQEILDGRNAFCGGISNNKYKFDKQNKHTSILHQSDKIFSQRATLASRSGKRTFSSEKTFDFHRDMAESLEKFRLDTAERRYRFDWDRQDNFRLGSGSDSSRFRLGSGSDTSRRLSGKSRLDSRENVMAHKPGSWIDGLNDARLLNSRGSDRRYNVWSRPETREKLGTPSDKSVRVSRRRVQLVNSPQYITETEIKDSLPIVSNEHIKSILKRGKPKCVVIVHGTG